MSSTTDVINESLVAEVLKQYFKNNVFVINFNSSNATQSGDNYCSTMKRITIKYRLENEKEILQTSLIVKYLPNEEYLAKFITELKYFNCEVKIYESILPKLLKLGYGKQVAPGLYYSSMKPKPIIVLEDLVPLNYKVLPRKDGFDLKQCSVVIKKLAYFHAASAVLHEQEPTALTRFNKPILRKSNEMDKMINLCYDETIETCKTLPELHQFVDKLTDWKTNGLNKFYNVSNYKSKFKVLNHGDFWVNNILFCFDEQECIKDLLFVDFQSPCLLSPCLDLHYFLATSAKLNVKQEYDVILDYYFKCLLKYLNKLEAKILPQRSEIYEDFRSMAIYGLVSSIVGLPFMKADKRADASIEDFTRNHGKDSFRHHCFNNNIYIAELLFFLPFFDQLGVFDV